MHLLDPNVSHTAVVIGGGGDIGRATAHALASAGAIVAAVDINEGAVIETAALTNQQSGGNVKPFVCDISSEETVKALFTRIRHELAAPTILINAAWIWVDGPPAGDEPMPARDLERLLSVNLMGPLWTARAAWQDLAQAEGGGVIVNVNSVQADFVFVEPNIHNATKAALHGMTHTLAAAGRPHGIRVNEVAQGPINTQGMGNWTNMPDQIIEEYRRAVPAGRHGTADEVAYAILTLCSSHARHINGATLVMDGNMSAERRLPNGLIPAPRSPLDPDSRM